MPLEQKAKCQSSSKTTTERNLRDDIILVVRYLNDLEITFPLHLPERSIFKIFFKRRNIITQVSRFNSTLE